MQNKLNQLAEKELSRKDFLKFIAGGVVVLMGLTNFITYLSHFHRTGESRVTVEDQSQNRRGFGSSKFGA